MPAPISGVYAIKVYTSNFGISAATGNERQCYSTRASGLPRLFCQDNRHHSTVDENGGYHPPNDADNPLEDGCVSFVYLTRHPPLKFNATNVQGVRISAMI